jgi:hypothetical protein
VLAFNVTQRPEARRLRTEVASPASHTGRKVVKVDAFVTRHDARVLDRVL